MPEVLRIVAPNPGPMTLDGTNTYLVGRDPCYVIDPGPDDKGHVAAIKAAAAERGGIGAVLLTHSHGDHADAAGRLGEPVVELADGESDGPLTALATPGHAADHVCFLMGTACFCGDLILGEGSSFVPPAAMGGSLADYMASLERLQGRGLEILHPGHGADIVDPETKIAEYLEHRREREAKLVAALAAGERSRKALLDKVWADVPENLRGAAEVVMQGHLEKLEAEGGLPPDIQ